jgi:hypothetical protein
VADDLTASKVSVLDQRDLARPAAEGFRQGIELASKTVTKVTDHGRDLPRKP